jgi:hypothetical protein
MVKKGVRKMPKSKGLFNDKYEGIWKKGYMPPQERRMRRMRK